LLACRWDNATTQKQRGPDQGLLLNRKSRKRKKKKKRVPAGTVAVKRHGWESNWKKAQEKVRSDQEAYE